jgi:hypothetical protein
MDTEQEPPEDEDPAHAPPEPRRNDR